VKLIFYAKYLPKSHKSNKATFCEKERGEKRRCGKEMGSFREKERENGERGDEHTCCSIILTAVRLLVSPAICWPPFSFFSGFSLSFTHTIPISLAPLRFESLSAALFISLP